MRKLSNYPSEAIPEPSHELTYRCETCNREAVTAVWSRGYWWCAKCFSAVDFPAKGKLIPSTIMSHEQAEPGAQ